MEHNITVAEKLDYLTEKMENLEEKLDEIIEKLDNLSLPGPDFGYSTEP